MIFVFDNLSYVLWMLNSTHMVPSYDILYILLVQLAVLLYRVGVLSDRGL